MLFLFPLLGVLGCFMCSYLIFLNFKRVSDEKQSFARWLSLNPKKGLSEQPMIWLCIFVPFSLFVVFGCFAWRGYEVEFSAEGFNQFLHISKLPLGLLALALPCAALAIRIHSTHQTALQIEVTDLKNKQDAYYAHEKFLHEMFGRLPGVQPLGFQSNYSFPVDNRLYSKIYPTSSSTFGVGEVSSEFLSRVEDKLVELGVLIYYVNTYSSKTNDLTPVANIASKAFIVMHCICYELFLELPMNTSDHKQLKIENQCHRMVAKNVDQMVGQFRYLREYVVNLFAFAGIEMLQKDSRMTHIIEHPMYLMIRKADSIASIYKNCGNTVYKAFLVEIPPD